MKPSTNDLKQALAKGGAARLALFRVWGDHANTFCDALVLRLPEIKEDTKIHCWVQRDGLTQVNIDVGAKNAYTVDIVDDPLQVIGERLGC